MRIFVSAGETSGDQHAARLVRELRLRSRGLEVAGFGGPALAAAGASVDMSLMRDAVMGWTGVVRHAALFSRLLSGLRRRWADRRPDAVVLVDYPGFNMRVAAIAHQAGVSAYYYICPQVWAWGSQRLITMRRILRRAFPILPFEEALYRGCGIRASYVGHPLTETVPRRFPAAGKVLAAAGLGRRARFGVLLPGSRPGEVEQHLPVFLEAVRLAGGGLEWVVIAATAVRDRVTRIAAASGVAGVRVAQDPGFALRSRASLALAASGTATLELGFLGVPQAVAYRGHWLNWTIARSIVKVRWASLVNLLLGREEVREFLQGAMTPGALAGEMRRLMAPAARVRARARARQLRSILGERRPSRMVAEALMADLKGGAR
jgi:lipid-A-disaccharide synthase